MQPSAIYKRSSFYKFGTNLFLIGLLGSIISGLVFYFIIPKDLPSTYIDALKNIQSLRENLYLKTYVVYLPIAFFIFVGVVALSRSMTKKIVEPLKSVSDFSRILERGDFSQKQPVGKDDLYPLTNRLDDLITIYQAKLSSVKEAVARLEDVQKNIEGKIDKNAYDGIKGDIKELVETVEKIEEILDKIRA